MTPIDIEATHRERAQMSTRRVDLCGVSMHAGWLECMKGTRGGFVEKSSCLTAALGVTKFTIVKAINSVTLCCAT